MVNLTAENFEDIVEAGVVIVDAWAPWCSQCPRMDHILKQVEPELGETVSIAKLDVSENMELAQDLEVTTLPTLLLYRDGKLMDRKVGIMTKPNLLAWIDEA